MPKPTIQRRFLRENPGKRAVRGFAGTGSFTLTLALTFACAPSKRDVEVRDPSLASRVTPDAAPEDSSRRAREAALLEEAQVRNSAELVVFLDQSFERHLQRSPERLTSLGRKDAADRWDDLSERERAVRLEMTRADLSTLRERFNPQLLTDEGALNYKLFEYQSDESLAASRWHDHAYLITHMDGLHTYVPTFLINMHRVESEEDARDYISRLVGVELLFDQLITNLERQAQRGILPPAFVYPMALEQSENVLKGEPFAPASEEERVGERKKSPIWADFTAKIESLNLSEAAKAGLISQGRQAMLREVGPSYRRLIRVLQAHAKQATADDGAWKLPDGESYYAFNLREITTTQMTSQQIHDLGLVEVARIHNEMRKVMQSVGFAGSLHDFFDFMRNDPRFYERNDATGRAAYLDRANRIISTMNGRLDELFLTKPQAPLVVRAVEAYREKSAGKAFYQRGTPDGSRPGVFYANLYDMKDMPIYQLDALAYHEGIPGHHMQISIAQELKSVPAFRRHSAYTAYTEGWGLYSELLPKELGLYQDPYADFGRLAMELWRACRLVLDTGIHAKKWDRARALAYLLENTPAATREAQGAVDRYIVWPGQATAYKIGMIRILDLRRKAKKALGSKFDIREFHDVILKSGPLPLSVLDEQIDAWIAEKQGVDPEQIRSAALWRLAPMSSASRG